MQEATEQYIERNGVKFTLTAINEDGEVLLQASSQISFDDVASESYILDEAFQKLVIEAEESKDDAYNDAVVKDERSY
jgi:hypothetical protein